MAKFGTVDEARPVIRMWSGQDVDLLNPSPEVVLIDDIAAHLAKINRFVGATSRTYTVAEHCLLGLDFCLPGTRLEYLMHDASEAYLGDVSGPLKRMLGMQFYRDLEVSWTNAIVERFGLKAKLPAEVKEIDRRMLVTEQRDLCGRQPLSTDRSAPFSWRIPQRERTSEDLRLDFLFAFSFYASKTEGARR